MHSEHYGMFFCGCFQWLWSTLHPVSELYRHLSFIHSRRPSFYWGTTCTLNWKWLGLGFLFVFGPMMWNERHTFFTSKEIKKCFLLLPFHAVWIKNIKVKLSASGCDWRRCWGLALPITWLNVILYLLSDWQ